MHIGGTTIPTSMDNRGTYLFDPPKTIRTNGAGLAVASGYSTLSWNWARLNQTEWNWWCTTVLTGEASKRFTSAELYNHMNVLKTFTNCVVMRPTREKVKNGKYINVKIEIANII